MKQKQAIIIGAGPAGLTAAYELLTRTDIKPIVIEKSGYMGGISRTINYKGNRIDIGGHRFFSKSDQVMKWWLNMLPLETQNKNENDRVMLVRHRLSRILFNRTFFDYPISLSGKLLWNLGFTRSFMMGITYFWRLLFPIRPEKTLADFYINRFGDRLYETFFKGYSKKLWGVGCDEMSADWGAQRVKGLSGLKTIVDFCTRCFRRKSIEQKNVETSLITQFLYPKYGPGQMWDIVAEEIKKLGGEIYTNSEVVGIDVAEQNVTHVCVRKNGNENSWACDYLFSSMAIKDLIRGFSDTSNHEIQCLAADLPYRNFITVGLLLNKQLFLQDTWIYVQEPDVKMGRIQVFNNWSPYMVADSDTTWLGLEYFCTEGDEFWTQSDEQLLQFGRDELVKIKLAEKEDIIDGVVIRMEKTYPGYWGSYEQFDKIKAFVDQYQNLFLIGRNGMHRYNNQDHSMLSAMKAVDLLIMATDDKASLWHINAEKEYHEVKHS